MEDEAVAASEPLSCGVQERERTGEGEGGRRGEDDTEGRTWNSDAIGGCEQ